MSTDSNALTRRIHVLKGSDKGDQPDQKCYTSRLCTDRICRADVFSLLGPSTTHETRNVLVIMTSFAFSKLSPFSLSLIDRSPPTLPQVPTLSELKKQAQTLNDSALHYTATPKPIARAPPHRTVPWYTGGTPPPTYSEDDPFDAAVVKQGKLKKVKIGWSRLGDGQGDGPKMKGSRCYASE